MRALALRWQRWMRTPYEPDPARRLANAQRAVARQAARHRDELGFLADVVPPDRTETPEERVARYNQQARESLVRDRKRRADDWRDVRRRFRALPRADQERIAARWNASMVPADPCYLACLIAEMAPTPEQLAQIAARRERDADIIRRAAPWWYEHSGCGGVLQKWVGGPYWTCLRCEQLWDRGEVARSTEAGEVVQVLGQDEQLSLTAATGGTNERSE